MPNDNEVIELLRSINNRLGKQNGDFDALDEYEQRLYMAAAIKNTPLSEVVALEETTPELIVARKAKEDAENAKRVEHAKLAGARGNDDDLELAAQVGASAFMRNRRDIGA